MEYRLEWSAHWSTKHEPSDPRILTIYHQESDGWWEHNHYFYFLAGTDEEARLKAKNFIDQYDEDNELDIYSLTNLKTKQVILTEEE